MKAAWPFPIQLNETEREQLQQGASIAAQHSPTQIALSQHHYYWRMKTESSKIAGALVISRDSRHGEIDG